LKRNFTVTEVFDNSTVIVNKCGIVNAAQRARWCIVVVARRARRVHVVSCWSHAARRQQSEPRRVQKVSPVSDSSWHWIHVKRSPANCPPPVRCPLFLATPVKRPQLKCLMRSN